MENDADTMKEETTFYIKSTIINNPEFYYKAQNYWSKVPATINGMLGGLGFINDIDMQGSNKFLRELKIRDIYKKYALDCGAGIGRVSKYLLMPKFSKVDLVEQDVSFAKKAREYCTQDSGAMPGYPSRLGQIYNCGLQEFQPTPNKYDLVWSQWVLGHLTDNDLSNFFQRIRDSLTEDGYFVIKESVTSKGQIHNNNENSSIIRPLQMYEIFLRKSGFFIVKKWKQKFFHKELYAVYAIAAQSNHNKNISKAKMQLKRLLKLQ